jgi:hypothetical protein
MQRYKNISGTSGVRAFELASDHIDVMFDDGRIYRYDHTRPGAHHVERMEQLAREGRGLATYINQHVRNNFAQRTN